MNNVSHVLEQSGEYDLDEGILMAVKMQKHCNLLTSLPCVVLRTEPCDAINFPGTCR